MSTLYGGKKRSRRLESKGRKTRREALKMQRVIWQPNWETGKLFTIQKKERTWTKGEKKKTREQWGGGRDKPHLAATKQAPRRAANFGYKVRGTLGEGKKGWLGGLWKKFQERGGQKKREVEKKVGKS